MRPSELDVRRWRRIDRILDAALDSTPDERQSIIADACEGDEELRREVEALLEGLSRSGDRFEEPATIAAIELASASGVRAGARVGRFRVLREIGRGGMGVLYLAEDTRLARRVALKALPAYLGAGAEARSRFEAEARAVSALDHPNIATLHEINTTDEGQLYMVFAYYEGEPLDVRIARGPLPVEEALAVAAGIAEGLSAAHASGIVHRDVKPSNVLLTDGGPVKLLDFGVAKVAGQDLTEDGVRLGTLAYMSPEQVASRPVDGRSDLWALGVVVYEMLTGSRPFAADDAPGTLHAILHRRPAPATALRPELSVDVTRVVDKLLSKQPDRRYPSAEALVEDLRLIRAGRTPEFDVPEPPEGSWPELRRMAVLPLADLTGSQDLVHVVHGLHDALIAELGKVQALQVVSRTSVMRFGDTDHSIDEIARILNVDGIVEGSVSRDGSGLAITTQLIAVSPERHLWAETYRTGLEDVLDVPRRVARSIAAEIEITLSPVEERRLAPAPRVDPAAYEAFTLGSFHLERRSPDGLELAQKYLRRAIEADPGFAPAHAMLGEACGSAAFFGLSRPADTLPVVRSLVDKALALDDTLPAAHATLGAVRHFGDWDPEGAETALRKAIALNPSYAYAHFLLADVLSVQARYEEAFASAVRNTELEQFVPFSAFGPVIVLNYMRRYEEAVERAGPGIDFFTEFWQGHWLRGVALIGLRRYEGAVQACREAAERSRRTPMALGALGVAQALGGDHDAALRTVSELDAQAAQGRYVAASSLAVVHGALGDLDRAFACLERSFDDRDMGLVHMGHDVLFDVLRSEPRFPALLDRAGFGGFSYPKPREP
jgi:serine/threonine protein kinase/tetratricopeptide (TPR) repeat protein